MDLVQKTMEIQENGKDTILVHCSAGVGRTGTFIAVYKLVADYLDNRWVGLISKLDFKVLDII